VSRTFRDAVLQLAKRHPFARRLVNSGRLSVPRVHVESPLNTPDSARFGGAMVPGAPAADAPVIGPLPGPAGRWFLPHLEGGFTLAVFGAVPTAAEVAALADAAVPCRVIAIAETGDAGATRAATAAPTAGATRSATATPPAGASRPGATGTPHPGAMTIVDAEGLLATRYDGQPGTAYLFRPDQHVCARWRGFDLAAVRAAIALATARH